MRYQTKVILHADGFMAMKWSGFLFWKEWKPISWTVHRTREGAEKEARDWDFYVSCPCKSSAV